MAGDDYEAIKKITGNGLKPADIIQGAETAIALAQVANDNPHQCLSPGFSRCMTNRVSRASRAQRAGRILPGRWRRMARLRVRMTKGHASNPMPEVA